MARHVPQPEGKMSWWEKYQAYRRACKEIQDWRSGESDQLEDAIEVWRDVP